MDDGYDASRRDGSTKVDTAAAWPIFAASTDGAAELPPRYADLLHAGDAADADGRDVPEPMLDASGPPLPGDAPPAGTLSNDRLPEIDPPAAAVATDSLPRGVELLTLLLLHAALVAVEAVTATSGWLSDWYWPAGVAAVTLWRFGLLALIPLLLVESVGAAIEPESRQVFSHAWRGPAAFVFEGPGALVPLAFALAGARGMWSVIRARGEASPGVESRTAPTSRISRWMDPPAAGPRQSVLTIVLASVVASGALGVAAAISLYGAEIARQWEAAFGAMLRVTFHGTMGVVLLAPLLLVRPDPWLGAPPRWTSIPRAGLAPMLVIGVVVLASHYTDEARGQLYYLGFLPLVLAAMQCGMFGVAVHNVVAALAWLVALQSVGAGSPMLQDLDLFLATTSATGLLLGGVVSERRRAMAAVQHRQARLDVVHDLACFGDWELDFESSRVRASESTLRIFGLDTTGDGAARGSKGGGASRRAGEADGSAPLDAFLTRMAPEDMPAVQESLWAARQHGDPIAVHYRVYQPDGRIRFIHARGRVIEWTADGRALRAVGSVMDVTETQRAQQALIASERELRRAQAVAHLGSWRWAPGDAAVRCSGELYRILGVDRSTFTPTPEAIRRHILPADLPELREVLQAAAQRGERGACEARVLRPFGDVRTVAFQVDAEFGSDGRLRELVGAVQDVTDRQRVEQSLRESEQRFRRLFDESPTGVAVVSLAHEIERVNTAMSRMLGRRRGDLVGKSLYSFMDPRDRLSYRQQSDDLLAGKIDHYSLDLRMARPSGRELWVNISMRVLRDVRGRPVMLLPVLQDITERKAAEQKLRQQEEDARALAAFNRRLLREVNHRVRNNLASLLSLFRMTAEKSTDVDSFREALELRLTAMSRVHDVLAEQRWRSVSVRCIALSVAEALQGVVRRRRRLAVVGDDALLSSRQATALGMVVQELFTNSCKHGAFVDARGEVKLRIRARGADRLELVWIESGGPAVREPRRRGLGLSLIEGLVQMDMDGEVEHRFEPTGYRCLMKLRLDDDAPSHTVPPVQPVEDGAAHPRLEPGAPARIATRQRLLHRSGAYDIDHAAHAAAFHAANAPASTNAPPVDPPAAPGQTGRGQTGRGQDHRPHQPHGNGNDRDHGHGHAPQDRSAS